MIKRRSVGWVTVIMLLPFATAVYAEQAGSIRGLVMDADFDAPLAAAEVMIAETGQKVVATDEGNYVFSEVQPGTYTLVFSKDGYARQVKADVVVSPGQMTEADSTLSGDFTEMEEFVVQDVQIGTGTEAALLDLRMESPALMDSISADLMSQAGAGDAASALKLVSGATVQDGKYATIRGLPDRYVNSQMNGVRLPPADPETRAVQLDQFPSSVIESIQVSKTFTPDQQGDASGGAVNVVLKGIPQERVLKVSGQYSYNSNVQDAGSDFLTYDGGGVSTWARDNGKRDPQLSSLGESWDGAVGVSSDSPNTDFKWSVSLGDRYEFEDFTIGAFGSFFYERDSSYTEGVDDSYWVDTWDFALQEAPYTMSPRYSGGGPVDHEDPWYTSVYDVTQGSQYVQWGGLGVFGFETENHAITLTYMYTRDAEDTATLSESTRVRGNLNQYWDLFYPDELDDYDFDDVLPGTDYSGEPYNNASVPRRNETLEYTERTTETLQLHGDHTLTILDVEGFGIDGLFSMLDPQLDWTVAQNSSRLYQPDKRLFSTLWIPDETNPVHVAYTSGDSFLLGNLQRIWKDIQEDSTQYFTNIKLPFEQWSGDEGYVKLGLFNDSLEREYDQDSYSNLSDSIGTYYGSWEEFWSAYWNEEEHAIEESFVDVDYLGEQDISAWYYMVDMPLNSYFNIIGGMRYERTDLSIEVYPDLDEYGNSTVNWYPDDTGNASTLNPGDADVDFQQDDVLPSIGFELRPLDQITIRGSYSETIARQTFKELTPIQQQEYLGGEIFIGNPSLRMSALKNYDLRFDWTPYRGALFSTSWFKKDVTDPIEYVAREASGFEYTKPVNYPEGELHGWEFEVRQQLGSLWENLEGFSVGANLTLIDSEVTLTDDEAEQLEDLGVPEPKRDMTNAPEHLYNIYATYELPSTGTQLGLFYTVRGDTLVRGAASDGDRYIPSVYETEYGTLNFSLTQKLGEIWKLKFQAKNLLDPEIESVYRSDYIVDDVTRTSYTKGRDFSISLSATF